MGRKHVCVCGRPAEKSLPNGIDGLFIKGKSKEFEIVCGECYRRIGRFRSLVRSIWTGETVI